MLMLKIRNLYDSDLDSIKELDHMLWLSINWNGTFHKEDAFVAEDETGGIVGVCALSYDATWYYLDKERDDIPLYRLQLELRTAENSEHKAEAKSKLAAAARFRLCELKHSHPDKRLCIRCWCDSADKDGQHFWLSEGFVSSNIVWIFGFDLTKGIPNYEALGDISIDIHDFDGDGMDRYLKANALGFDGVQDAEAELRFRLHDDNTKVFVASENGKVLSSVTVWSIGQGRSATENIFTIPDYRHRNLARATIAKALSFLRERGDTMATLTCVGDNRAAISLYIGMGYRVVGHLVELRYIL